MTTVSLSRMQARLASWQRARGTARVVVSVTAFSVAVSVTLCATVFRIVYGDIDAIRANIDATGLILPIVVPLLTAPMVTVQLTNALGVAASVIDELEATRAELQHLALHDPLTGLLNRRGFFAAIAEMPPERLATLVLATVDVDEFKTVNDTYGHAFGDRVLVRVAKALSDAAGPGAIVARIGGDEFAACLGQNPGRVAHVRRALQAVDVDRQAGDAVEVRCSLGTAEHRCDVSFDDTLAVADAALYEDKRRREGRGDELPPVFNFRQAPR